MHRMSGLKRRKRRLTSCILTCVLIILALEKRASYRVAQVQVCVLRLFESGVKLTSRTTLRKTCAGIGVAFKCSNDQWELIVESSGGDRYG